jgi:hypothetical protein
MFAVMKVTGVQWNPFTEQVKAGLAVWYDSNGAARNLFSH